MMARSTSLAASASTTASRLLTASLNASAGCSSRKRASSCGAKYLAVLVTPRLMRPPVRPRSASRPSSASASARWIVVHVPEQQRAGFGQVHPPADALEQRQPGVRLELAHLHRHAGLGQVQLLGGARERQVARGGLEDLQLAQRRVAHGHGDPLR